MPIPAVNHRATIRDLERHEGKAELIDGRIVPLSPTGFRPGRIALRIARSLDDHAERTGRGFALGDNIGFRVPVLTSGRESFSPDAAYFAGPEPVDPMRFIDGPPTFAVEVRSENDRGPGAESEMAAKVPITSRPVPSSSGISTPSPSASASTAPTCQEFRSRSFAARRPTPNPPCQAGM